MLHSILALFVLLVAAVLAIYNPRGVTTYGWRKEREARAVKPHQHDRGASPAARGLSQT